MRKIGERLSVDFSEIVRQASESEYEHELVKDLEMLPNPTERSIAFINELPFSMEEVAARLLELEKRRRSPPKSLHL